MELFPAISLIDQGEDQTPVLPGPREVLVLYVSESDFVERVFKAASYTNPQEELALLAWEPGKSLLLAQLVRRLGANKVVLFGQDLKALGLHFRVAPYFPVTVAGCTYLVAESDVEIAAAKAAGNNGPAGRLWRALQNGFIKK
ncbi:MAG: hypothetical protein AAFZ52_11555 [Bacteroidota bacterium]